LAGQQTIGDGELYRTLRELQKQNFEFPSEAEVRPPNHAAKTRRGYVK